MYSSCSLLMVVMYRSWLKFLTLDQKQSNFYFSNKAPLHNLGEERSVGLINYELSIRGKENLEASSRKLVLNRSFELLEKTGKLNKFRMYKKAANDIKELKIEWNTKMQKMERDHPSPLLDRLLNRDMFEFKSVCYRVAQPL